MVVAANCNPNEITIIAVFSACAQTGDLASGKWVHAYISKAQLDNSVGLKNSLVDMYAKYGKIDVTCEIFDGMLQKDIVSWNVMIDGLAPHGLGEQALARFSSMQGAGIQPDDLTFIGVLSACSRGGLVEEGFFHFWSMTKRYGIKPKLEHYGCMADLLSRAEMLEEADKFIREMPMKPDGAVCGVLLSGCRVYNNVGLGKKAAKHLFDIEPGNDGVYVFLSNTSAQKQQWEEVKMVRDMMQQKGICKTPGCSSIVVDEVIHEFIVGDHSHSELQDILDTGLHE